MKGSGGDLGTLTEAGLAVLRLDRLRALVDVYPGEEREDEMVAAFDFCLHGTGGAAPSIDTAMHGLVDAAHVDHLHPDSGIAIATAADGEQLTKAIYGDTGRVGARGGVPASSSASTSPPFSRPTRRRSASSSVATASRRGARPATRRKRTRRWIIETAQAYIDAHGDAEPFGPVVADRAGRSRRRARPASAAGLAPHLRAIASRTIAMVGHFTDDRRRPRLPGREKLDALAELGTSCPDHFLRTKVKPLDRPGRRHRRRGSPTAATGSTGPTTRPTTSATPHRTRRRCAAPIPPIILVPGVGMFSYGKDKQTARVAGEFYVNAINVMRGAETISTYAPIPESEKFRIEYWALEEAKLATPPAAAAPRRPDRAGHRRGQRHRPRHRRPARRGRARAS